MNETERKQSNILQNITDKTAKSSRQLDELIERLFVLNGTLFGTERPLESTSAGDRPIVGKLAELEDTLDSQAGKLIELQELVDQLVNNLG